MGDRTQIKVFMIVVSIILCSCSSLKDRNETTENIRISNNFNTEKNVPDLSEKERMQQMKDSLSLWNDYKSSPQEQMLPIVNGEIIGGEKYDIREDIIERYRREKTDGYFSLKGVVKKRTKKHISPQTNTILKQIETIIRAIGVEANDSITYVKIESDSAIQVVEDFYRIPEVYKVPYNTNQIIIVKDGDIINNSIKIDKCIIDALKDVNYTGFLFIHNINCKRNNEMGYTQYAILLDNIFYWVLQYSYNLSI